MPVAALGDRAVGVERIRAVAVGVEVHDRAGPRERRVDARPLGGGRGRVDRVVQRQRPAGERLRHRALAVVERAVRRGDQVGRGRVVLAPAPGGRAVAVLGRIAVELADAQRGVARLHGERGVERRLVRRVVVRREPRLGAHRLADDEERVAGPRAAGRRVAGGDPALDRLVRIGEDLRLGAGVVDADRERPPGTQLRARLDDELHRLGDVARELRRGRDLLELDPLAVDLHRDDGKVLEVEAELVEVLGGHRGHRRRGARERVRRPVDREVDVVVQRVVAAVADLRQQRVAERAGARLPRAVGGGGRGGGEEQGDDGG